MWTDTIRVYHARTGLVLARPDGHDAQGLIDKFFSNETAVVEDIVEGLEDAVEEPVVVHELPDILALRQAQAAHLAAQCLLGVDWPNSSQIHCAKSINRQRTTPCDARIGALPGALREASPSGPSALKRNTFLSLSKGTHNLKSHPANLRRLAPATAIKDHCQSQQTPNLIRIPAAPRQAAQISARMALSQANRSPRFRSMLLLPYCHIDPGTVAKSVYCQYGAPIFKHQSKTIVRFPLTKTRPSTCQRTARVSTAASTS
jgi:hypothetical protein